MTEEKYPPIGDFAFIADCHASALVSKSGSIDWCCMPRFDSGSIFGRLLDWRRGGYCWVRPHLNSAVTRQYLENSLVLKTTFTTDSSKASLIDFFSINESEHFSKSQIIRIVEGVEGTTDFVFTIAPVFDYGTTRPWIRNFGNYFTVTGGNDGLLISSNVALTMKHRHYLVGRQRISKGQRLYLSMIWKRPEELEATKEKPPTSEEIDIKYERTRFWWNQWCGQGRVSGPFAGYMLRSAIVLKGLINASTGAITAAATTSLPERIGGTRNWDYRLTWIRDSYFSVRALADLGFWNEANGFRKFIERTVAGSTEELQILYGIGGERRVGELQISEMEGYRKSKPVRSGNDAKKQIQLDIYGELLGLAWVWHKRNKSPDNDYWDFLVRLVNCTLNNWRKTDHGIWEMRIEPRHFVLSKVMCWSALNRGIALAQDTKRQAPIEKWRAVRDEIHTSIEENGYNRKSGVYIQAFDSPVSDASLLLIPHTGYIEFNDERMIRTTDNIMSELMEEGFVLRYRSGKDGFSDREGAFLACSFWLAECLAYQNRTDKAMQVFKRALHAGNDLGLFSEEYNPHTGELLGNFPQGLTHLSLINAALALERSIT